MPEPTARDAELYLRLLEISQGRSQSEARRWFFSEFAAESHKDLEARYPKGGSERAMVHMVLEFFEAAGVLVSRGLLHEDVFFDAPFGLDGAWPKVERLVASVQKETGDPAAWENVQWLGRRYQVWREKSWKPKSEMKPPEEAPEKPEPHVRGFQHG